MPAYDVLNTQMAPGKSVFDTQQVLRPTAYRHCGRASLCIGMVCILAEICVFVFKRGLTTMGIGIWTGASFVIFGATSMAVPKTRSVCSVNTCFVMALGSMAICVLGIMSCVAHALMLNTILDKTFTPRPNFELSCEVCGYLIIMKEVGQIILLLAQFLVSLALLYFAYTDCLCCRSTETEVVMSPVKFESLATSGNNHQASTPFGGGGGGGVGVVSAGGGGGGGGIGGGGFGGGSVGAVAISGSSGRNTCGPMLYEL